MILKTKQKEDVRLRRDGSYPQGRQYKNSFFLIVKFLLALIPLTPSLGQAQDEVINSMWTSQPSKIDGSGKDWKEVSFVSWKKGEVQYAFKNDAENLYILLIIKDPKFLSSIEDEGITLYFSSAGKKSTDYGILFKKKRITAEECISLLEKEGALSEDQKAHMRASSFYNYYSHEVFHKKAEASQLPQEMIAPPALFKYAPEQKTLVHEFAIPLARVHAMAAGVGALPGMTVMIGFEWGGLTEEQRKVIAKAQDIANETNLSKVWGDSTDITAGARRIPAKYSFWCTIRLSKARE